MGAQTYFRNLSRSGDKLYSRIGKIGLTTSRYVDRVSGRTASRVQAQADMAAKMTRNTDGTEANKYLSKIAPVLQRRADALTAATKASRIRTGVAIGSAALIGKAISNHVGATPEYSDYSNYNYGNGLNI